MKKFNIRRFFAKSIENILEALGVVIVMFIPILVYVLRRNDMDVEERIRFLINCSIHLFLLILILLVLFKQP